MLLRKEPLRLYCFSPPVMIATFIFEIGAALYTLWRYKLNEFSRVITALLVFLAIFQLAEYFVCGGLGLRAVFWSRVGYASITMLPPLGLHLMFLLAHKRERSLVRAAYSTAIVFCAYFLLHEQAFTGHVCTGNYVIFQIGRRPSLAYGAFYYGWILTSIWLGAKWWLELRGKRTKPALIIKKSIALMILGYMIFIIPTALANTFSPETRSGIPSIMCGFAVLFAVILVGYILPAVGKRKKR